MPAQAPPNKRPSAYAEKPALDFSSLDELYEGHQAAYLRMLEAAITQCATAQTAIYTALKKADTATLRHATHKLRPLLKMLHYADFLQALDTLLDASTQQPIPPWDALLQALHAKRNMLHPAAPQNRS